MYIAFLFGAVIIGALRSRPSVLLHYPRPLSPPPLPPPPARARLLQSQHRARQRGAPKESGFRQKIPCPDGTISGTLSQNKAAGGFPRKTPTLSLGLPLPPPRLLGALEHKLCRTYSTLEARDTWQRTMRPCMPRTRMRKIVKE